MARGAGRENYGNYPGTDPSIRSLPAIPKPPSITPAASPGVQPGYDANTRTRDNWQALPGYGQTSNKQAPAPQRPQGAIPTERDLDAERAATIKGWNDIAASYQQDINQIQDQRGSVGGESWDDIMAKQKADTWRYGSPSDRYRTGGGGAPSGGHVPYDRSQIIAKPDAPQFQFDQEYNLPDYEVPAEDKGIFKAAYADATAGYMKEVRNQAMQAIFSARSSQNPNERAMLVEAALSGAGKAYESIGRQGSQYARSEQSRQRAEQIAAYDKQWENKASEIDAKYEKAWQTAVYDFDSQKSQYATDYAAYASQPTDYRAEADATAARKQKTADLYKRSGYVQKDGRWVKE